VDAFAVMRACRQAGLDVNEYAERLATAAPSTNEALELAAACGAIRRALRGIDPAALLERGVTADALRRKAFEAAATRDEGLETTAGVLPHEGTRPASLESRLATAVAAQVARRFAAERRGV